MFCVELLLGRGRRGERGSPFFIILRCILICTSNAVSVMDDTQGKITAQKAKGEKRDPERIKKQPIVMLHPDQRLGAGRGPGGIPGRGWEVQGLGTEEAKQKMSDGSSAYSSSTLVPKVPSPLQPGQASVWYRRRGQPTSALGTLRICWKFASLLPDLPTISRSPT